MIHGLFLRINFFIECLILSCKQNKFRSICLLIYLIFTYYLQFMIFRIKEQFLIITSFIQPIQDSILNIIRIPIRNDSILIARNRYMYFLLKHTKEKYEKYQNSSVLFKFKRIETVFSGLERDFLIFIQYFPSFCINIIQIFFIL